ncbi:unnamed protein product [Discosporangium mesarthrocarpum]
MDLPIDDVIVVGVAGGSGSGKTTLSKAVVKALGSDSVTHICHDSYYRNLSHLPLEARGKTNFDHPSSLETSLLVNHLKELKAGRPVEVPVYDFSTHTRTAHTVRTLGKRVILVEGILIFSEPELVEQMDIKIFVDTVPDLRLIRRMQRDVAERGRTHEEVVSQYLATVRPMHDEFVEPSKRYCDFIVPEGLNPVVLEMVVSRLQR